MKALIGAMCVFALSGCGDGEEPINGTTVSPSIASQTYQGTSPSLAPSLHAISRQEGAAAFIETLSRLDASFHALNGSLGSSPCPPASFAVDGVGFEISDPWMSTQDSALFLDKNRQLVVKVVSPEPQIMALAWRERAALAVLAQGRKLVAPIPHEAPSEFETECDLRSLVSEYVGDATLADIQPGTLPADEIRRLGIELLDRLEEVHSLGLIHGDVHAANVVTNGSSVKLIDFGRARTFLDPATGEHLPLTPSDEELDFNPMLLSIPELEGWLPSRRDDLFRLAELLVYLAVGDDCLYIHRTIRGRRVTLIPPQREIIKRKRFRQFPVQVPRGVAELYRATTAMRFEEEPNYQALRSFLSQQ